MEHRTPNLPESKPDSRLASLDVGGLVLRRFRAIVSMGYMRRIVHSQTDGEDQVDHRYEIKLQAPVPDEREQVQVDQPHVEENETRCAEAAAEDQND